MRNIDIYPQDKIYSDLVGVWYPAASAGADDGPTPPPVEQKVNFGGAVFQYIGNAPTGAKEAWSCDIKLDFIEQEPDMWYATVRFNDYVYEAENDYSDPHPTENVDIQFGTQEYKPSIYNGLYGSYNLVWVIGGTPTSAVITIYVDGEVWTTATTNVIKIQGEVGQLEGNSIIDRKSQTTFDYEFDATTEGFNFNNLEEGWYGQFIASGELYPSQYGDVVVCEFNANDIISNTSIKVENKTAEYIPINGFFQALVKIFDNSGLITLYESYGQLQPIPEELTSTSTLTRKSVNGFDFEFEITTANFDFNNLPSGWYGEVVHSNNANLLLCTFDINDITTNNSVVFTNQSVSGTLYTDYMYVSIKIYDSTNKLVKLYESYNQPTIVNVLDKNYFYIENQTNNPNAIKIIKTGNPSTGYDLQWSKNGFEWFNVTFGSNINIDYGIGKRIYLRSTTGFSQDASNYYKINYGRYTNYYFSAGGDIRTLIDYTNMTNTAQSYAFYNMFSSCSALNGVSSDLLSNITVLNNNCYQRMFYACNQLANLPLLPATTLAVECYKEMFYNCSRLNSWDITLPATTMTANCYEGMFRGCSTLRSIIPMSATTLASYCFKEMYRQCIGLNTSAILSATTMTNNCYESMFYGCLSLPSVQIGATTLAEDCFDTMLYSCQSLTSITTETSEWDINYSTNWVQNAPADGTFYNNGNATIPVGNNGIPSNWTEVRNNQ